MSGPISERLSARVTRFGRLLRAAGVRLGTGEIVAGLDALAAVDVAKRDEFYWALHSTWVCREEDRAVFMEAFRLFWRRPDRPVSRVLEELFALSRLTPDRTSYATHRRVTEALDEQGARARAPASSRKTELIRLEASANEVLRTKDFEQMTAAELREAERALARLSFPTRDIRTRRWRATRAVGTIDLRRTIRASLRSGHGHIPLQWRRRRTRPPGIVALCDISGSMAGYTRMLVRFLHALTNDRDRVHTFLFGTRLTNVTRALRHREADTALAELGGRVRDWEGGTRIGRALEQFNRGWSRRVLAQGSIVLLITDGLEREDPGLLGIEAARLSRSARRLIWLNPLLRYAEFSPEARGIKALLPHVHDFRPVHDLTSLQALAAALST